MKQKNDCISYNFRGHNGIVVSFLKKEYLSFRERLEMCMAVSMGYVRALMPGML